MAAHRNIWHQPKTTRGARGGAADRRPEAAADAEAEEEDREDQREGIDGAAEEQRQEPRPDHLGRERRRARQRDRHVDGPGAGHRLGGCDVAVRLEPLRDRRRLRDGDREQRDHDVQRHGDIGRDAEVVDAQEVEAGRQAADDAAADVAAVEEPEPRHAFRRRLDPAGNRRQRGPHQQRRRQQADGRGEAAEEDARDTGAARHGHVEAVQERHAEEDEQAEGADAQLQERVDAQRMLAPADVRAAAGSCRGTCRP